MNNNNVGVILVFALGVTSMVACDVEGEGPSPYDNPLEDVVGDDGRVMMRLHLENAQKNNGLRFNGLRFNGLRFNGLRFNGLRFNGLRFNGISLGNPRMVGNNITGDDESNNEVAGAELEDARFDVDYEDPEDSNNTEELEYSFTQMETTGSGLVIQAVKHRVLPAGDWENACENDAKAVQIRGDWDVASGEPLTTDSSASTWACLGAALADCAVWGYVPGEQYSGQELRNFHQACTRLKRADYCGIGQHHTENGHSIDVYDALNLLTPATVGVWDVEAMWGPEGAICMNFTRKLDYTKDINEGGKEYIGCEIPNCVDVNEDGVIDFADYPTALLADRTVPAWKTN